MNTQTIATWLGTGSLNIFGMPFAGKDTQCQALAKLFGGVVIGGGDILRSHHDPKKIEDIMASGGIIPSDFYLGMVLPYLSRAEFAGKPLILSAVGRSHGEEDSIIQAAQQSDHPLKAVVVLTISEDVAWQRFAAAKNTVHDRTGRADDSREALKTRSQKFKDKTVPVIAFYRRKGLLIEVDGSGTRDQVTQNILSALTKFI